MRKKKVSFCIRTAAAKAFAVQDPSLPTSKYKEERKKES